MKTITVAGAVGALLLGGMAVAQTYQSTPSAQSDTSAAAPADTSPDASSAAVDSADTTADSYASSGERG